MSELGKEEAQEVNPEPTSQPQKKQIDHVEDASNDSEVPTKKVKHEEPTTSSLDDGANKTANSETSAQTAPQEAQQKPQQPQSSQAPAPSQPVTQQPGQAPPAQNSQPNHALQTTQASQPTYTSQHRASHPQASIPQTSQPVTTRAAPMTPSSNGSIPSNSAAPTRPQMMQQPRPISHHAPVRSVHSVHTSAPNQMHHHTQMRPQSHTSYRPPSNGMSQPTRPMYTHNTHPQRPRMDMTHAYARAPTPQTSYPTHSQHAVKSQHPQPGYNGVAQGQPSRCRTCHQEANYLCSKCCQAWYCSRECQVKDWPSHRQGCKHSISSVDPSQSQYSYSMHPGSSGHGQPMMRPSVAQAPRPQTRPPMTATRPAMHSTQTYQQPPTYNPRPAPTPNYPPKCAICGKTATCKCSICGSQFYCGRECQIKAWTSHKANCQPQTQPGQPQYRYSSQPNIQPTGSGTHYTTRPGAPPRPGPNYGGQPPYVPPRT